MTHFMGTHSGRIDAKGRVSIPAPFRAALRFGPEGVPSLILRPGLRHACIEGWPRTTFDAMATAPAEIDAFSAAQEDRFVAFYADATDPPMDKEGRIVLPPALATYAGITDQLSFIGVGASFQIWEPAAAERRKAAAKTSMSA